MPSLRLIATVLFLSLAPAAAGAFSLIDGASSYQAESAIMSSGSRAAAVRALRRVPSVGVVNLNIRHMPRFRDSGTDISEYKVLAGKYRNGIQRLRAALAANPVTRAALDKRGIPLNRVVGVSLSSNGSLRLYLL